jgi:Mrp family chromosome partitioning ATPase
MNELIPVTGRHKKPTAENIRKHYKSLISNLDSIFFSKSYKSILFVGTSEGNGTSTIAASFAQLLAKNNEYNVLLVDANFNSPGICKFLKETNYLSDPSNLKDMNEKVTLFSSKLRNLYIFICDKELPNPEKIFQRSWFELAYEKFDYIIFDGATAFDSSDIQKIATNVDGTVLVVEAGKTRQQVALRAKTQLELAGGNILGVILNKKKRFIPEIIYRFLYK